MTFSADRLVRNDKGYPMGRCVLKPGFKYVKGIESIPVALCEFPKIYVSDPRGMTFMIDGIPYTISKDVLDIRINRGDRTKIVINTFSFIKK